MNFMPPGQIYSNFPITIGYYVVLVTALQVGLFIKIFWDAIDRGDVNKLGDKKKLKIIVAVFIFSFAMVSVVLSYFQVFKYTAGGFPLIAIGVAAPVLTGATLLFLKPVKEMIKNMSIPWAAGIQLLRSFGLIFPILTNLGLLHILFGYAAGFGDIAVGVLAPLAAYLYYTGHVYKRKIAIAFNIISLFDVFCVAITTFILTLPGLFPMFQNGTSSDLMNLFPMAPIPLVIAPFFAVLSIYSIVHLQQQK